MSRIKSKSGFSVVEVMVGFGLMGFMAAGMATMFENAAKGSSRVDGLYNVNSLIHAIDLYTLNSTTCTAALSANLSINYYLLMPTTTLPFSLSIPGIGAIQQGRKIDAYSLTVSKFELRDLSRIGVDSQGRAYIVANVVLAADINKSSSGGAPKERPVTTLNFQLNPAGLVTACGGPSVLAGLNSNSAVTNVGGSVTNAGGSVTNAGGSVTNVDSSVANVGGSVADVSSPVYSVQTTYTNTDPGTSVNLPGGSTQVTTASCNAACVVIDFFNRNSTSGNPTQEAQVWMNSVGTQAYTTYANAYSMDTTLGVTGIQNNALATGGFLGYSTNTIDSWTIATYGQYSTVPTVDSGASLYQATVQGYNAATSLYSTATINDYIATVGVATANSAALIVNSAVDSGMSAAATSSAIAAATSKYSNDTIATWFAGGHTLQEAVDKGLL